MSPSLPEPRPRRGTSLVPDSEFVFTESDFRKIAALVHGEAGIVLSEGKVNLVYSRLTKRLRTIGLRSFRDYCALVESDAGADERQAMIAAMTTNVTRFYREPHHFDYLRKILTPMAAGVRAGQRLRIWSAACSSGEEPYTIALTLLDVMPDAADHDVRILATDIDPNMVARGRAGLYPRRAVGDVPPTLRERWMHRSEQDRETMVMADTARNLIQFNELNLLSSWPMKGRFDVIFCRNVMIYFDEQTQDAIWAKFARQMTSNGVLFIGHSERIATERHPFEIDGQTTYLLRLGH